ncbi:peptide chain release factor N(5)-glutamine methyltransferase [Aliibacillus thermotolerans]|uniref:Release factor glutamine methyltransferase n=1 Tax=Aliibacillus thermotolerans TaxID=1834418 RepID=A0ABW0U5L6_9BACI|nr:peptide chain release factor N(5)-glutamine methyltransferase [Aliibacillus thermotolerans]MDA3129383.1 peptide chain release factor N(5)-glutamine methyltransferase [Aliibacillus thermotolerans]
MSERIRVYEALQWASSFLEKHGREMRAADILLKHHLHVKWTEFHLKRRDVLSPAVWEAFQKDVKAHSQGIPVQHLIGYEFFYGRRFSVSNKVLIPRPETEELVAHVIESLSSKNDSPTILDLGTGSGAIAITLALEIPKAKVCAVDISEEALHVAIENNDRLGANVTFLQGDLFAPVEGKKWDVIVANPPYIPKKEWEQLDVTVKDHEPALALIGDEDKGVSFYEEIARKLPVTLKKTGFAFFEIGYNQGAEVKSIMEQHLPKRKVTVKKDINGKDRIVQVYPESE